jgi:hypothetical protein
VTQISNCVTDTATARTATGGMNCAPTLRLDDLAFSPWEKSFQGDSHRHRGAVDLLLGVFHDGEVDPSLQLTLLLTPERFAEFFTIYQRSPIVLTLPF